MFKFFKYVSPSSYISTKSIIFFKEKLLPILDKINETSGKQNRLEYLLTGLSHHNLKRPYLKEEKIDIVFIFQSPSFWPSWESVWDACNEDSNFNPIMLVSDNAFSEKEQFKDAQKFLKEKRIPFKHISEVNLSDIRPHVVVLHTPYDGHRPKYLFGGRLSSQGYRVMYITYGIEISDIPKARSDHFTCGVTVNAWRVYTFSKEMIPEYKLLSPTGGDMVRSFGHPKFDYLNKEHFPTLPVEILSQANGRKIILWKVHFPKKVNGKMITPSLTIYKRFLEKINSYEELFFIFMPHPKFYEELGKFESGKDFQEKIKGIENIIEYVEDDYRPVLVNCDYYIMDRSALMIEAGVTGKPILYVSAEKPEAMTKPIQKIVDSYYQANSFSGIERFLESIVVKEEDPMKENRVEIFKEVISLPSGDGSSGYRVKEDIINTLKESRLVS